MSLSLCPSPHSLSPYSLFSPPSLSLPPVPSLHSTTSMPSPDVSPYVGFCSYILTAGSLEGEMGIGTGWQEKTHGDRHGFWFKSQPLMHLSQDKKAGQAPPPRLQAEFQESGSWLHCSGSWVGHLLNSGICRPGRTMNFTFTLSTLP